MKRSLSICAAILTAGLTTGLIFLGVATRGAQPSSAAAMKEDAKAKARLGQTYAKLPLRFESNAGQTDARVKFLSRGAGYSLFLTPEEAVMQLRREDTAANLRMRWLAANPAPRISGEAEQSGVTNYLAGRDASKWQRGIASFGRVKYESVWNGVDLIFYGNQQQLEYDFRLAAGADPARIRLAIDGAERVRLDTDGALLLEAGGQQARWLAPVAYQEVAGARREIRCQYRVTKRGQQNQVEFALGAYDRRLPLVIDPVFVYSTTLGGLLEDAAFAVASDEAGNTYVAGSTSSPDFPTVNPVQAARGSQSQPDAFVLKIAPSGGSLVYATYLGGAGTDLAYAIAVDATGNAYVAGETDSSNFPSTAAGIQPNSGGFAEAFLVKLNPSGSQLVYSTRLGGSYFDRALGLAIDAGGNAYVAGQTDSPDFPVVGSTRNGDFTTLFKSTDAATNWNASGQGLPNSTVRAIAFNPANGMEILAATNLGLFKTSNGGGQWTPAAALPSISGGTVSVSAIAFDPKTPANIYLGTPAGVYKSFNGGQSFQLRSIGLTNRTVTGLAIDPVNTATLYAATAGGVFKTTDGGESWLFASSGLSNTTINNIAISPNDRLTLYAGTARGVFKTVNGGTSWTVASNGLGPSASLPSIGALAIDPAAPMTLYAAVGTTTGAVLFKTTDGGANWRASDTGLATMSGGVQMRAVPVALTIPPAMPAAIYAATPLGLFKSVDAGTAWTLMSSGITNLNLSALAVDPVAGAVYAGAAACTDAFVAKVNPAASAIVYSLVFGGSDCDIARGVAVDAAGAAWVTGDTMSANFPTANPRQAQINGPADAFVAKLNPAGSALAFSTFLGGSGTEAGNGIALDAAGNAVVVGETASANFPAANGYKNTPGGGGPDGFIAKYKADGSAIEYASYFGGNSTDQIYAVAVDKTGNAWVTGSYFSGEFPEVNPLPGPVGLFGSLFVTRFSPDGRQLLFSSLIRGGSTDTGRAIAVDAGNNVYVAGIANSFSFPLMNPVPASNATPNGFALKLGPVADLAVTIADSPDPVLAGEQLAYTVTVGNRGDVPLTGVRLTDTLPQDVTLFSLRPSQGTCSGTTTIACELGTLAEGAAARVTIVVTAPLSGTVSNTATVSAAETESNSDNNTATASTAIVTANLALEVTPSHLQIVPGGTLTWYWTIRNTSAQRISAIQINNSLPAQTSFVSCATSSNNCSGVGNERTVVIPGLAPNGSAMVTVTATVNSTAAPGVALLNLVRLSPVAFDPNPGDNESRITTTVVSPPPGEPVNGLIAFSSGDIAFPGTNLIRPDGGGRFMLSTGSRPAWSPDGRRLVVVGGGSSSLSVLNADGTGLTPLPGPTSVYSPTWSPDGTRLAFHQFVGGIYIMNADGTGLQRVLDRYTGRSDVTVRWSPDGARLLVAADMLFHVNLDGSGITPLTVLGTNNSELQPDYSPDGTKIVFFSRRDNSNGELYVINADGSGLARLTNNTEAERYPTWSPDGKKIAYGVGNQIVIINADGTSPVRFAGQVFDGMDWQRALANQPRTLAVSGRLLDTGFSVLEGTVFELTGTRTGRINATRDGYYSFGLLPEGGSYTIRPTSTFLRFDPPSRTYSNLTDDQINANFTVSRIRTVVRGRVTDFSGAPMAGVRVVIGNEELRTETDADGNYVMSGATGQSITIRAGSQLSGANFEPASITLPPSEGERVANFKGLRERLRINGQVTTGNGAGVADVTVSLAGGGRSATATTDSQGRYSFADLPGGFVYAVSAAKSGVVISPATRRVALGKDLDVRFFAGVGSLTGVSAASYSPRAVTVAGIVALFGQGVATNTQVATGSTLPTTLDGVSVFLTNRNISARQCRLFFVSPGQINAALPTIESFQDEAGIYAGEALVEVRRGTQVLAAGSIEIERAAPAVFTANASGTGFPLAVALRVRADNSQVFEPISRFDPASGQIVAVPIDVSNPAEQVFLVLFATGLRFRGDPADVGLKIGNENAPVTFAGIAPGQTGVDQVNALIPRSLTGKGEVDVLLTAEGRAANTVKLNIR